MGKFLDGALGGARRKRAEPVVSDTSPAAGKLGKPGVGTGPMPGDDDFTGPVRGRDRVKAGFRKVGAFNKRIQDKFQARRARFGNKGIGGYRRGGGD